MARTHAQMVEALFQRWNRGVVELPRDETHPEQLARAAEDLDPRGRGSGASMDMPSAWIFDFEDGRCRRLETFSQRVEEARRAARSAG